MSLEAYINTDQKPSEVNDFPWLICADDALEEKYCDGQPSGKWMMFFPKTELDSKWLEACDSFRKGKLTANNETLMVEYGQNLLENIHYKPHFGGKMYYKSNEQTTLGTRATGRKRNHLYEIELAK